LARLCEAPADDGLTRERGVLGTPDFMAPEQARDARRADVRADIYSLGCTLFFLLSGQPPFPTGTTIEKVLRHQLERAPALSQFRSDLHPDLIAIVNRLMRKDPAERHQTPIEVAEDLAGFMGRTTIKLFTWPPLTRSKKG